MHVRVEIIRAFESPCNLCVRHVLKIILIHAGVFPFVLFPLHVVNSNVRGIFVCAFNDKLDRAGFLQFLRSLTALIRSRLGKVPSQFLRLKLLDEYLQYIQFFIKYKESVAIYKALQCFV